MPSAESETRSKPPMLPNPEDVRSVLVLGSSLESDMDGACGELLGVFDPDSTDYLTVSLTESPDARLQHWREHVDAELPARVGVVCCGETRSVAVADGSRGTRLSLPGTDVQVTNVSSPGDLTGLGMKVSKCASAWEDDGNETVFCFDSLTTLLQYADLKRVFQFVHVLLERLQSEGAFAHFHLDPSAHDDRTLATLRSLFDAVVEADDARE